MQAAIDTALQNNEGLSAESFKALAAKKMQQTAWSLPNAELVYGRGQIQSNYQDDSWEFTQKLAFPGFYGAQKKVLKADYQMAQQDYAAATFSIKAAVSETYYQYLHALEKERIYQRIEKQLAQLLKLADLRLAAGESNIIEKSAAAQQMAEALKQLQQVKLAVNSWG